VNIYVKVESGTAGVLANETVLVSLLNCALQDGGLVVELTTDVDVCRGTIHGTAGNHTSLDELVRVLAHNLSVLARSWLTLIGVDNQVPWLVVLLPSLWVHERPLETRGETGSTAASQSGLLDLGDDLKAKQSVVVQR
jgi:hypothetical protein